MDAGRRAELVQWASRLETADGAELRAAGRAIRQLVAEIEALEEAPTGAGENGEGGDPRGSEEPAPAREPDPEPRSDHAPEPASEPGSRPELEAQAGPEPQTEPELEPQAEPEPPPGPPGRRTARRLALAAAAAAVAAASALLGVRASVPELEVSGPPQGALLGAAQLTALRFETGSADARWTLDGRRVEPRRAGDAFVLHPAGLGDGEHTLTVRRNGPLFTSRTRSFTFAVDTTPPGLELDAPAVATAGEPLRIEGRVEPGATLTAGGRAVPLDAAGRFALERARPPRRIVLVATDAAGNASRWRVPVTIAPRVPAEPVRAVHVTAYAWADETLRHGVLRLIAEHRINAVELDLKDESGEIGWDAPVPLARKLGALRDIFDLEQAVKELHAKGVRVIGRLVCFRDPIHAAAAWRAGRRDEVVQTPSGGPYAGYGGFTNFASPEVRRYNIGLALAAAKAGVDEILYDYVRRPDGPLSSMRFPGLSTSPEQAITSFLAETRRALAPTGALLGASVFGVAATRPKEVAQDIPAMARQVDYIAPMVYPSHWAPGEYDVADPNGSPYRIVRRSLADFRRDVRGTGARVVPWLQDFSLGRDYGREQVAAQIRAARDAGMDEFLLWDPAVTYTREALPNTAKLPALALAEPRTEDAPGPVRLPDPAKKQPRKEGRPGAAAGGKPPLSGLAPNELGRIPVLMHHRIATDRSSPYDQTPAEFRAELRALWKRGYVPVSVSDLLDGNLDLPKGASPVVMTFDDSSREQLALDARGRPKPDTAVGIMLEFAHAHPGFEPAGTFYVTRDPFGVEDGTPLLRWLAEHGFELGNHTYDHRALRDLSDGEVRREIALGARVIESALPGYRIRSLALPLGSMPRNEALAVRGRWRDTRYGPYAVLLVGANPAPSPFSRAFDPAAIPRIRSSHLPLGKPDEMGFSYWLAQLDANPDSRYVSDGDPDAITAPASARSELAPRFAARFAPRSEP